MSRVCCVTGAAGYIGSWLVKKLLGRGCVVHATMRQPLEIALLKHRVHPQIVATPSKLSSPRRARSLSSASGPRRWRVIYTGSVVAASPLKEDGSGYKDVVDESCWTPLGLSYGYNNEGLDGYVSAKTLCEKALLSYQGGSDSQRQSRAFEVVTLLCGLVGGDTLLPFPHGSLQSMVSPLITGDETWYTYGLKFMQALLGAVPLVHVDDACEAHVFCMDRRSIAGRFLCAAAWPNMRDIVDHYRGKHDHGLNPAAKEVEGEGVRVQAATSKLLDLGFRYRYGAEEVLDCSVECAKRLGVL
ncbi:hypothetical protein PR202_gb21540 [Eleusine coracana subsp. coracana]|uniref:NAD-dependent epimerase/dehydratase domain-containing protein n=1 Tax=Eleusine coracana subsp. coracana TaxID=191504 RepID=A0AAV5FDP0_ELECO|nr:hypothetical protein PR202_gb21540 [Eleusine coracana subsp. coracana]